jgi:RimJ/RimL family protein N-acetyltransferase
LCGGLPDASIDDVVAAIVGVRPHLNGVHGPRGIATKFAAQWSAATGVLSTTSTQERLHSLERLPPPTAVAGEPRLAEPRDEGVLADWLNRFRAEALGAVVDAPADPRYVRAAKELPDEFLLWTFDSNPVSMAGVRSPTAGVARIGPVYTPTDSRGHGYGSAATTAAAAWALGEGADEVVLFTDLTNPAVDTIYQYIGFRPVSDFVRIDFSVAG